MQLDQRARQREADAQPPVGAVGRGVDLHEGREHPGDHLGGDAHAGVAHAEHRLPAPPLEDHRDLAARFGVLGRVGEEVHHRLLEPRRIGVEQEPALGLRHRELVVARVEQRPGRLDGPGGDVVEEDALPLQGDLAAGHPRHVEQIVHQAHQARGLPLEHVGDAQRGCVRAVAPPQGAGGEDHGGQRVPELVPQHGEELVLALIGLLRLAVEPGVVDGQRGVPGQLLGEELVVGPVGRARAPRQHHRAHRAPVGPERHAQVRGHLLAQRREPGGFGEQAQQIAGARGRVELRRGAANHRDRAVRRVGVERQVEGHAVLAGEGGAADVALAVEQIDGAIGAEVGQRDPRRARDAGLEVERLGERSARRRDVVGAPLQDRGLLAEPLLARPALGVIELVLPAGGGVAQRHPALAPPRVVEDGHALQVRAEPHPVRRALEDDVAGARRLAVEGTEEVVVEGPLVPRRHVQREGQPHQRRAAEPEHLQRALVGLDDPAVAVEGQEPHGRALVEIAVARRLGGARALSVGLHAPSGPLADGGRHAR